MADLTTRDELRELRARAICQERVIKKLEISGVMAINPKYIDDAIDNSWENYEAEAEATMKAEEAAGLASVPLEATEEMIKAFQRTASRGRDCPDAIEAAIATGNLLTKETDDGR